MMAREEAIRTLENGGWWDSLDDDISDADMNPLQDALGLALAALRGPTRDMVERMRGCSDCQRKTCVSCRRFGWVPQRCVDCNDQDKWSPWNFCPVCGKPLTDEAVDMMVRRWREAFENA